MPRPRPRNRASLNKPLHLLIAAPARSPCSADRISRSWASETWARCVATRLVRGLSAGKGSSYMRYLLAGETKRAVRRRALAVSG